MWTIGQSQRVDDFFFQPIVRKIQYLVFVGEFKKNRRTYRTVGQKLTRSDLNFLASDPMSGAIFQ
jgi:hypothetical protein